MCCEAARSLRSAWIVALALLVCASIINAGLLLIAPAPEAYYYYDQAEHRERLGSFDIEVIVDPRTMATECILQDKEREHCILEAIRSGQRMTELDDAPLRPSIPFFVTPEGSQRHGSTISHHRISCWPGVGELDDGAGVSTIVSQGGHCVLLIDRLDAHEYKEYTQQVYEWFLNECTTVDTISLRVSLLVWNPEDLSHTANLTAEDGRWGSFNDVLSNEEIEIIEASCWDWLVDWDLAVDPHDVFIHFILYAEEDPDVVIHKVEALVLSLQKNGGKTKNASGALLVYTEQHSDWSDLRALEQLLSRNSISIVFMPMPPRLGPSEDVTLHFLKTDMVSYEPAWRHQAILFMDIDILVLEDVMPFLSPRHVRMAPATRHVTIDLPVLQRHGLAQQPHATMNHFGVMKTPFFNAGLIMAPARMMANLVVQVETEARLELELGELTYLSTDQIMFQIAQIKLEQPFLQLPATVNLDSALSQDDACLASTKPILYHYHRNPLFLGAPLLPSPTCSVLSLLSKGIEELREHYRANRVLRKKMKQP